jgi:tight adherence protein B
MTWQLAIAAVTALLAAATVVAWWQFSSRRRTLRGRLENGAGMAQGDAGIFRAAPQALNSRWGWLSTLTDQAGYDNARASVILLATAGCAIVGGIAAWRHTGGMLTGLVSAVAAGSLPYFYLLRKRNQRFQQFEQQFPDALDMMTRSIRAGHALSGAIGLVGEEMPDPVGQEFRRVFEEIRLGLDPGEALSGIPRRVPTEDTGFFYTAISIQRIGGGNLAEILDRLAEVIRDRFKLLKQARVLSTQHRWTAICVGLSPFVFALIFELTYPGYFDPLLNSPYKPYMITAGLVLETIGFFSIWRIAQIKV